MVDENLDCCESEKEDKGPSGKGVAICGSMQEAKDKIKEILEGKYKSSRRVVLEEYLKGEEISYFSIVHKNSYQFFGSAQDHKKVGEGDTGPNTGGMGAYSPSSLINKDLVDKLTRI